MRNLLIAAGRRHWPIIVVACVAGGLLLANLSRSYLWEDEGDTAVLARNILHHGLPVAWDGVTFTDPDYGQREAFGFVMVSHPWLQYYAAAASFAVFGETVWAARLPFAIAGLATIVVVYAMILALLDNRRAAVSAAILLTLSAQFLVFATQARNYSFNALLTCLLIWQFLRMESWRSAAFLALIGTLLFHAHPIGLVAVASLGAATLVYRPFATARRWFWYAVPGIALGTAPWLFVSHAGYTQNSSPIREASQVGPRLLQFIVECASVTPIVGLAALYVAQRFWRRPGRDACPRAKQCGATSRFTSGERSLVVACGAIVVGEAVGMAVTHSRDAMWVIGLHHTPAIIPIVLMLTAVLITKASGFGRLPWVALLLLFGSTRFAQATPWTFWARPSATRDATQLVTFHVPNVVKDRLFRTGLVHYVRSLGRENPGTIERVSEFLNANAAPGDVVITNYEWEALYFHTGLPQGAKIEKSFPIYSVAQTKALPRYVFGADSVRWIVWRRAWPAYFPAQDCERILRQLAASGVTTELVANIPETGFENRENIHFRRFAGNTYVFPWYRDLPDVVIYRVDWHSDLERVHQHGKVLFAEQKFEEALVPLRQYLDQRPDDVNALTRLATALAATGRLAEAIPVFRRAAALARDDGIVHRNLANALYDDGQMSDAVSHAMRAVTLMPWDPAAADLLGRALAMEGRFSEATASFERALQVDPGFHEARTHLERLRQLIAKGTDIR